MLLKGDVPQSVNRLSRTLRHSRLRNLALGAAFLCMVSTARACAGAAADEKWVASWAAAQHGPYPSGNAAAGPDLRFAFLDPPAGAHHGKMRLPVRTEPPDRWLRPAFSIVGGGLPLNRSSATSCTD